MSQRILRRWAKIGLVFCILLLASLTASTSPVASQSPTGEADDTLPSGVLVAPVEGEIPAFVDIELPTKPIKHPKLASQLVELSQAYAQHGRHFAQFTNTSGLMLENRDVLVEILFNSDATGRVQPLLEREGMRIRHHNALGLYEAWLPIGKLEAIVIDADIYFIRPARLVQMLEPAIGNSTSQGVAASNANVWQAAGIDGTGVTIANIDGGYTDYTLRQASGDWPSGGQLTTVDTNGGGFGSGSAHGTATVEINYDIAPGATFLAYETTTIGDWYNALVDAATVQGADIASVSLGAPLDGIGDGTALSGSIAEAAATARAAGTLVVNAAGNSRQVHWGGLYNGNGSSPGGSYVDAHDWGAGSNLNTTGTSCYSTASQQTVELFWDDWTNVNHDYDLFLFQHNAAGTAWQMVASSTNTQNGGGGQTPQEYISYTPTFDSGICPAGFGYFAILVAELSAATDKNLQVFTSFALDQQVFERSLGFPADSADVFTVAAIDVTTSAQESYSSEGPILGPGGTIAGATHNKPDAASFANVDTEAYGAGGFNGTSSAAPHVAGIAALMKNCNSSLTPDDLTTELHNVGLTGANDLGTAGFDTLFGYGRITLPSAVGDGSDFDTSYGTAVHTFSNCTNGTIWLGSSVTTDFSYMPNTDNASDDGVTLTSAWAANQTASVDVEVGGSSGWLAAWVDWDGDGSFSDPSENIIDQAVSMGTNSINFTVDNSFVSGSTAQMRFRVYAAQPTLRGPVSAALPTGTVSDGEVEDHTFTPLAVQLANFIATEMDGQIKVRWQTVSELNNLGFNLYRAEVTGTSEVPVTWTEQLNRALIPAQAPGSGQGAAYEWQDDDVSAGTTYYYWLEDVDTNGQTSSHGPVSATTNVPTVVTVETLESKRPLVPRGWLLGIMAVTLLLGGIWHKRQGA